MLTTKLIETLILSEREMVLNETVTTKTETVT